MMVRRVTRAHDEQDLAILAAFRAGVAGPEIARQMGCTPGRVFALRSRVRDDDLRYSGEPRAQVRAAYERAGS